jgi:hypothetical protein
MALLLPACAEGPVPAPKIVEYPLGLAYAGTEVNATIFRQEAVTSDEKFQYVVYYNPQGNIVVARRSLGGRDWDLRALPILGKVSDGHDDAVIGLSGDGVLHLSYDHHNVPLNYRRAADPKDWAAFGPPEPLTGKLETRVTYPTFTPGTRGDLYFSYRDGQSGNGRLCLDYDDPSTHQWSVLQSPLLEGAGQSSPYWWRPEVGADGVLHLAWCWRDTPDAATNHDLNYARSRDGGKTWENSAGEIIATPITRASDTLVFPIAKGQNLMNQCSLATDAHGHPHIAYYCNGPGGVPQYFHCWFDGEKWSAQQVSQRTRAFSLGGQGTLELPISRPEIAVSRRGIVYLITRDQEFGGGIRLYAARAPYTQWQALDVWMEAMGDWEPSYDLNRWRRDGVLALFVLPVHQGNNEKVTDFPPQTARVVELAGLE